MSESTKEIIENINVNDLKNKILDFLNSEHDYSELINELQNDVINSQSTLPNEEKEGLVDVFEYLKNFDIEKEKINIFVLSLIINSKLYSHCGDGSFGGKLRSTDAYLRDTRIELLPPSDTQRIFNSYIPKGDFILEKLKNDDIIGYIDDVNNLLIDLIKLQPFADGNKRTFRMLTNILFKEAGIPPISIDDEDKNIYREALIRSIEENNSEYIEKYIYYKIFLSIERYNALKKAYKN